MPKRPCAVRILEKKAEMTVEEEKEKDGVVILCGDKFGDVYSLPLLYTPKSAPEPTSTPTQQSGTSTAEPKAKIEHRIAGGGIITTRRNKIAAQKAAKAISRNSVANLETKELPFENTHLLGHVSLLTDVLPITLEVEIEGGRKVDRTWILTADKDEHIRVSRYPKAYVIEGFCLGHTLYVTSLMVLSGDKNTLISGGGDDYLLRWNWLSGKAVQKILLREHIMNAVEVVKANRRSQGQEKNKKNDPMDVVSTTEKADENEDQEEDEEFLISVTGIWEYVDTARGKYRILVAVEG